MPDNQKSLAQSYHEDVEALKAEGVSNAEAIRQVADKYGKNVNAVRGGIHQYKNRNGGGSSRRGRQRPSASVDDYLANARKSVEDALALIDREADEAKAALDAAQARYDEIDSTVKDRKADLQKRLKALS